MRTKKKLLDLYPKPRENGIFFSMSTVSDFQSLFTKLNIISPSDFHNIDMQYLLNKSGLKTVSTLLEYFIDGFVIDDDGNYALIKPHKRVTWEYVMLQVDQAVINDVLRIQYLPKWNRLAETLELTYNPLNPYHMDIDENIEGSLSSNDNTQFDGSTNSDFSNSGSSSNSQTNSTYGYNNPAKTPTDDSEIQISENNSGNNQSTINNKNDRTYARTDSTQRNLTREGNIGNKSAMQLIEEERELLKWQILEQIYSDLDEVLTRNAY